MGEIFFKGAIIWIIYRSAFGFEIGNNSSKYGHSEREVNTRNAFAEINIRKKIRFMYPNKNS